MPELPPPAVITHLGDILFLTDRLDAFTAPIHFAQDADLVFRRIRFAFYRLVLS